MREIQGLTEDIRTSSEKKQKAKTRLRNEIGAVTAELRRTVDEHEQEKAMLEILKNEQKLSERQQNVKTFTETNLKNTKNFAQGIQTLTRDEIELTEERDVITEPYKQLILEHSDETSTYSAFMNLWPAPKFGHI